MKLNNIIILTISDFRRHFNFPAFWNSRLSFIRDMNPAQIFYYYDDDKKNYTMIAQWIEAEQAGSATTDIRQNGLIALSLFAKCNVTEKDWKKAVGMLDFSADIILAPYNGILNLPGKCMSETEAINYAKSVNEKEWLHKIEIDGDGSRSASIFIGGQEVYILKDDECIYVTEVKGEFLRLLPNSDKRGSTSLRLENQAGKFESIVIETVSSFGKRIYPHSDMTQFCFTSEGEPLFSNEKYYKTLEMYEIS